MTQKEINKFLRDFSDSLIFICDELERLNRQADRVEIDYAIDDIHKAAQYLDELRAET